MMLEDETCYEQGGLHQNSCKFCLFCEKNLLHRVNKGELEFKEQVVLKWNSYDEQYHLAQEYCFVYNMTKTSE